MKFQYTAKKPAMESLFLNCWLISSLWKAFSSHDCLSRYSVLFSEVTLSSSESKEYMCRCIRWPSTSTVLFSMSSIITPLVELAPKRRMVVLGFSMSVWSLALFFAFSDELLIERLLFL